MSQDVGFDLQAAHRYFSAACFNKAWDLIDQPARTPAEDEEMLRLSLASTWHWMQRADCTAANRAVGYWQTARIYALLGQAANARRYGELSLAESRHEGVAPFYLGYAYEALARAEQAAGNADDAHAYLTKAHHAAARIEDPEARKLLLDDLASLA